MRLAAAALACLLAAPALAQSGSACDLLSSDEVAALVGAPLAPPRAEPPAEGQTECGHYPPGFDGRSGTPDRGLRLVVQRLADETEARTMYFAVTEERRRVRERQSRSAGALVAVVSDVELGDAATLEVRAASHYATLTFYRGGTLAQVTVWLEADPGAVARTAAQRALSRLR